MNATLPVLALTALLALAPTPAWAEWFVFPFAAGNTGGQTAAASGAGGVSAGWGRGWWGAEGEFTWSPTFFDGDGGFRTEHAAATFTGTALVGPQRGGWRPYGAFGFGVLRFDIEEAGGLASVSDDNPAIHAGGGLMWLPDTGIGFRGDVRYIRSLDDEEPAENVFPERLADLDYWRISGGVVFRW